MYRPFKYEEKRDPGEPIERLEAALSSDTTELRTKR